jgi:DNA-binding MarR family transcriptional regulator
MRTGDRLRAIDASVKDWEANLPQFQVEDLTLMRLVRVASLGISALVDPVLQTAGLTESSFHTLVIVFAAGARGATPTDLCGQVGQTRANMTRILNLITAEGLVETRGDPRDARRKYVLITPQGRRLVKRYADLLSPIARSAIGGLPDAERKSLERLLRRLIASMVATEPRAGRPA